jgi:hypothetical protein
MDKISEDNLKEEFRRIYLDLSIIRSKLMNPDSVNVSADKIFIAYIAIVLYYLPIFSLNLSIYQLFNHYPDESIKETFAKYQKITGPRIEYPSQLSLYLKKPMQGGRKRKLIGVAAAMAKKKTAAMAKKKTAAAAKKKTAVAAKKKTAAMAKKKTAVCKKKKTNIRK